MKHKDFEKFVQEGIEALPKWVVEKIENVAFIVSDEPTKAQRKENDLEEGETLFGLYEGVPLSERGNTPIELPDRITIFKKSILNACASLEDVRTCVMNTVWHEVAHYFGHDEDWVEQEEKQRGKML